MYREQNDQAAAVRPAARGLIPALMAAVFLCSPLHAARIYPSAGSTSASFLKVGVGARAVGMAGAYTALSDDAYAVYWNPAGLALPVGKSLAFTHNDYFEGLNQEYFGFTLPAEESGPLKRLLPAGGNLGLGLNYFYYPKDMERRSGLNEADPLVPASPVEGKFGAYDLALSAAYGFNYGRGLRLGGAFKFIRQSIDTESGNTVALDLGGLYDFNWLDRPFTAGFAVQNLGPGVKLVSKSFPLPLTFRAGLSHRIYEKGLLLSMDLYKPVDNYPSAALGLEQPLSNKLFLRAGYRLRQHGNELGAFSGLAAGIGFVHERFGFDYAFSPFGDLGVSHRISLAFRFQSPVAPVLRPPTGAEPAAERLEGASAARYEVTRKPLKISPRGVDYAVEAVSQGAALYSLQFRERLRGTGEPSLEVIEGTLPPQLLSGLPKGYVPARAWQLGSGFAGVSGELTLNFMLPEGMLKTGSRKLFYMTSSGWTGVDTGEAVCEEGTCAFSARLPLSTHYVLAVKD